MPGLIMTTPHATKGNVLVISTRNLGELDTYLREDIQVKKTDHPKTGRRNNITADRCHLISFTILGPNCPLTQLSLRYNNVKQIPPSLFKLQHLRFLDLEYNQIEEIPPEIGYLSKSLTHLYLGHNLISHLPPQMGLLSLKHLTVDRFSKHRAIASTSPYYRWTLEDYAFEPIPQIVVETIIALDIRSSRFWNINGLLLGGFDDEADGAALILHGSPERILRYQPAAKCSVPSLSTFCLQALGPLDAPDLHSHCRQNIGKRRLDKRKLSKVLCSYDCILASLPEGVLARIEKNYPLVPCLVCGTPSCSDGIHYRSYWSDKNAPDRVRIPTDAILCSVTCLVKAVNNSTLIPFHARRLKAAEGQALTAV